MDIKFYYFFWLRIVFKFTSFIINSFKIAMLMMLVKRKFSLINLWKTLKSADTLQFSMFLALVTSLYKISLCTLRRINKDKEGINSLISGVISSLSAFFDRKISRRKMIILYNLSRSLQTSILYLDDHDIMKERKSWSFWVMVAYGISCCYFVWCEYDIALPEVSKLLIQFASMKINDYGMLFIYNSVDF